jgi:hypothetical protein
LLPSTDRFISLATAIFYNRCFPSSGQFVERRNVVISRTSQEYFSPAPIGTLTLSFTHVLGIASTSFTSIHPHRHQTIKDSSGSKDWTSLSDRFR